MQVIDNRALLITAPNAHTIPNHIAQSAVVEGGAVAVHWGLPEATQLAKLGFDGVPSPMLRDYQWTGKY